MTRDEAFAKYKAKEITYNEYKQILHQIALENENTFRQAVADHRGAFLVAGLALLLLAVLAGVYL